MPTGRWTRMTTLVIRLYSSVAEHVRGGGKPGRPFTGARPFTPVQRGRRLRFGQVGCERGRVIFGIRVAADAPFRLSQAAQPLGFVTRLQMHDSLSVRLSVGRSAVERGASLPGGCERCVRRGVRNA